MSRPTKNKRVIEMELSEEGIKKAIKELEKYSNDLILKAEEFEKRLIDVGIPVIEKNFQKAGKTYDEKHIESGSDTSYQTHVEMSIEGGTVISKLVVEGKDILFIEFGSGVYHNGEVGSSPNPKGGEFGYVIGSYGKGQGKKDVWAYPGEGGKTLSHGTEATTPVYTASKEMRKKMLEIAKEVFES